MARTVRDTNLETRAARLRLAPRRKPYWRVLEIRAASRLSAHQRGRRHLGGAAVPRRAQYSETKPRTRRRSAGRGRRRGVDVQARAGNGAGVVAPSSAGQRARARRRPLHRRRGARAYFADREQRGSKGLAKDRAAARRASCRRLARWTWRNSRRNAFETGNRSCESRPSSRAPAASRRNRKRRAIDTRTPTP